MSNIVPRKTYVLPAIVSALFPGVGQAIKFQFVKMVVIWGAGIILYYLVGWLTMIPYGILYIANILDALLSTNEENLFK